MPGLVGVEVSAHQLLKADEHVVIDGLAGGKLAVVEAQAMVEQHLDVGSDDATAVLVNAAFYSAKLPLYNMKR